jgi:hypothetical protein
LFESLAVVHRVVGLSSGNCILTPETFDRSKLLDLMSASLTLCDLQRFSWDQSPVIQIPHTPQ